MGRYRIRNGATELELPPGEFLIGRSAQCHLTIDDALVSRLHAKIVTEGDELFIEDLGSRNGFSVNSVETRAKTKLRHLDRIRIGNQDLVVVDDAAMGRPAKATSNVCRICGASMQVGETRCGVCGAPAGTGLREHATVELQVPLELRQAAAAGMKSPSAFAMVGSIASKALALGRIDEAERMLAPLLDSIGNRFAAGEVVDPPTLREAIDFATKLTEGPTAGRWITWLLNAHASLRRLPDVALVDALHDLVRRARYVDPKPVARLIEVVSANPHLTAGDKFIVKRLESLRRVISA